MHKNFKNPELRNKRVSEGLKKFWNNLSPVDRQSFVAKITQNRKYKPRRRDKISKELLTDLYYNQGLSLPQISQQLNIHAWEIEARMDNLGLARRSIAEGISLRHKNDRKQGFSTNYRWKGWKKQRCDGYISVVDPRFFPEEVIYIQEHRLVWEQTHNRKLAKGWIVHHINGTRDDNRPENLIAMPDRRHKALLTVRAEKIRHLEAEVGKLQKALTSKQLIFDIGVQNVYRASTDN